MAYNYISLEHKLEHIFGLTNYEFTHKCSRKLTYGNILYDGIKEKGGLYTALAVILAPYYFEDVEEIENFLDEIGDIQYLSLEEIKESQLEKIINKLEKIIKKVKVI